MWRFIITRKSGLLGRKINISSSCKSRHHMGHENALRLSNASTWFWKFYCCHRVSSRSCCDRIWRPIVSQMSEFLLFAEWPDFSADAEWPDISVSFCLFFFSDVAGQVTNEDTDEKILPYCDISKKSKKSLGEMEQEFLEALQVPNIFTTWRIHYTTLCFTALLVLWLQ